MGPFHHFPSSLYALIFMRSIILQLEDAKIRSGGEDIEKHRKSAYSSSSAELWNEKINNQEIINYK